MYFLLYTLLNTVKVTCVSTICWCLLEALCLIVSKMTNPYHAINSHLNPEFEPDFQAIIRKWDFFFKSLALCTHDVSGLNCTFIFQFPANTSEKSSENKMRPSEIWHLCFMGTFKTTKNVLIHCLKPTFKFASVPKLFFFFEWGNKVPFISIKMKSLLFHNENMRRRN